MNGSRIWNSSGSFGRVWRHYGERNEGTIVLNPNWESNNVIKF